MKEFAVQHLETNDDVEQFLELMRKVFGQEGVDVFVKKLIDYHPTMTLNDFFVVKHHEKIVTGLNLIPLEWSIGGVPLKVAEMGCVATLREYRHHGLQKKLVKEFDRQVVEQEYDLCAIEGIPYFYRQFGYEYALPLDEQTRIRFEQIPDYQNQLIIRPFIEEDVPIAMQLLSQSQSRFYVHSVRNEQFWKMQQETGFVAADKFDAYSIEDSGQTVAYIRIIKKPNTKELILAEASDANSQVNKGILKFLKEVAKQNGLDTLVSRLNHYDSLTEQLLAFGAVEQIPPYAWQIRIVDYARIFEKMKPLFERRLSESCVYAQLTQTLNFNFYRFTVEVDISSGKITRIQKIDECEDRSMRFNPLVFTKLLLGYRNREELEAMYPDVIVRPSHKQLVDVLFPKLPSYIHCNY
jgi:predicted acetyltransferase